MASFDRSSEIYDALLARIISWELAPGTVLSEVDLATQLSVSRTPVREALARLRRERFVHQSAGQSASVTGVTVEDAVDLFQTREALEPYALLLAARSPRHPEFSPFVEEFGHLIGRAESVDVDAVYALTRRFDAAVRDACGNGYLARLLEELAVHTARLRNLARGDQTRLRTSLEQRRDVAAAVTRGDGPEAARLDSIRLRDSLSVVVRQLVGGTQGLHRPEPLR